MSVTVFPSEPPRFAVEPADTAASVCSRTNVTLPEVVDPDSEHFTIALDPSTPGWIRLVNNQTLNVDPKQVDFTMDMQKVKVTFVLTDDSGAYFRQSFNLLFDVSGITGFNVINDVSAVYLNVSNISLNAGKATDVSVVGCTELSPIYWMKYSVPNKIFSLNVGSGFAFESY
eukprot:CAMPEP_0168331720 /NCGR_PEP_ID=MMETSP0213-20121227/8506_1 /TAXON_ID=151035 /ORGANISM="Euplotes harpa, Strain FSP1.4" /LENGTH=171 /DNA_ID=CAMNT_0008335559 /DNA_START=922 /DNA_END=1437 /DNA_ORIENTATION=+